MLIAQIPFKGETDPCSLNPATLGTLSAQTCEGLCQAYPVTSAYSPTSSQHHAVILVVDLQLVFLSLSFVFPDRSGFGVL